MSRRSLIRSRSGRAQLEHLASALHAVYCGAEHPRRFDIDDAIAVLAYLDHAERKPEPALVRGGWPFTDGIVASEIGRQP